MSQTAERQNTSIENVGVSRPRVLMEFSKVISILVRGRGKSFSLLQNGWQSCFNAFKTCRKKVRSINISLEETRQVVKNNSHAEMNYLLILGIGARSSFLFRPFLIRGCVVNYTGECFLFVS